MKKILVVEDHVIVRQGLIRTLRDILDEKSLDFHEASTGLEATKMACSCEYDLVLLDISLPDLDGLSVLKQLHEQNPKLPVVILSTHPEEQYAVRSLRIGAAGYVNKGSDSVVLKEVIQRALSGKKYVSPSQSDLLIEAIGQRVYEPLPETLSDREYQITCMLTAGIPLTQIAKNLSLSVKTVSTYRSRILEKLQLKTTADIISFGIHHGLTEKKFPA
jgi:two-component system, NarL family, invasion response regulator UvrY